MDTFYYAESRICNVIYIQEQFPVHMRAWSREKPAREASIAAVLRHTTSRSKTAGNTRPTVWGNSLHAPRGIVLVRT